MAEASELPSHKRLDQVLDSIGMDVGASEMHGVICGILSAGHADSHAAWFEDLFQDRPPADLLVREARDLLGQLYRASQQQLASEEMSFQPLLADDDRPIGERARHLSEWCQGYLYGLGLAGIDEGQIDGEAGEAIRDLGEFTRLDSEAIEEGEEAELAYTELAEFLRVATLLIREALQSREKEPASGGE